MTTPREKLVDSQQALPYHIMSRCVRRSFLCGKDGRTRRDYSHRKRWLIDRIHLLVTLFPIDLYGYTIMSNHFHMVLMYDPNEAQRWSDEEVAHRWCELCPPKLRTGEIDEDAKEALYKFLLEEPDVLAKKRKMLGSLSYFMKFLKQPIAYWANQEDDCTGHFFEQRFYSGALLDEDAMIDAMQYVDLNPVRAKLAAEIETIESSSITERLLATKHSAKKIEALLAETIAPLVSGIKSIRPLFRPAITLGSYLARMESRIRAQTGLDEGYQAQRWLERAQLFKRKQRAYGPERLVRQWIDVRGFQMREIPLS
ncbi:MAG: hypothetical protein AAF513_15790 [Pseudomonadota bacterium]